MIYNRGMRKPLYIILGVVALAAAYGGFRWWQSAQPCPTSDPMGLFTNCKAATPANATPSDPAGLGI